MNAPKKPQYASVEYPFPLKESPIVWCPICGKATYDIDEDSITPCPHLAFIFIGEDFEYKSQDFEKRTSGKDLEDLSFENFQEFLESLGYDNKFLAIEITHGGLGCGTSWHTDIYGFDYSTYC